MAEKNEKNEKDEKVEKIEKKETNKSKENEEVVDKKVKETNKEESKAKKEKTSNEEKSTTSETNKVKKVAEDIKAKAEEVEDKLKIDTEELKNETKDTVNQVKEVFSNGDIKEKTTETTHFLKTAFSDPFEAIEEIANEKNEVFPKTVILIALFVIISFVSQLINLIRSGGHYSFGSNFTSFISSITSPIIFILVPSAVVFLFNTKNRRKITTIISTITTCYIPTICATLVTLLRNLIPDLRIITNPIATTARALSVILLYFGIKNILDENDDKHYMRKFAIIYVIISLILLLLANIPLIYKM